jgi:carotenoid cleavage dioxygenase
VFFFTLFLRFLRDDVIGWQDSTKRKQNAFLAGNFAPIHDELTVDLPLSKNSSPIPNDFPPGMFIRNGPNPQFTQKHNYHWFEGDGHVHAIHIHQDKSITYLNRFVQTEKYKLENDFQGPIIQGFIDSANKFVSLAHWYRVKIRGALGKPSHNTANTALKLHAGKFLALQEGDFPTELRLPSLETVGRCNFDGNVRHHMTAHPLTDPKTKDLVFFGYRMFDDPPLQYSVLSHQGKLIHHVVFPATEIPWKTMHHSFAITEHYNIFAFYPLIVDVKMVGLGKEPIEFCPDKLSKFAIVPRLWKAGEPIHWFEAAAGYAFHVANAYEEGDEIVLIACRGDCISLQIETMNVFRPYLHEFRFNMRTGKTSEKRLQFASKNGDVQPLICDFPLVHDDYQTKNNRYIYAARLAPDCIKMDALLKVDMEQMTFVEYKFGSGKYSGEWVIVPKTSQKEEDDVYLCSFVHDENSNISTFEIVDGKDLDASKYLTQVKMPRRVPFGFHGTFVSESEMNQTSP